MGDTCKMKKFSQSTEGWYLNRISLLKESFFRVEFQVKNESCYYIIQLKLWNYKFICEIISLFAELYNFQFILQINDVFL